MIIPCDDPVSKGAQRFEIFTDKGKRLEWPPEQKASIVAECYTGGERVGAVVRRHGLDSSQVYAWRKDLNKQPEDRGLAPPLGWAIPNRQIIAGRFCDTFASSTDYNEWTVTNADAIGIFVNLQEQHLYWSTSRKYPTTTPP